MKASSILWLALAGFLAGDCSHTPGRNTATVKKPPPWMNGVDVRAEVPPDDPTHPAELELRVSVTNGGGESVAVIEEWPINASMIVLTAADGTSVPRTPEGDRAAAHLVAGGGEVIVKPGETCTDEVPLGRLFRLDRPGVYHVSLTVSIVNASNTEAWDRQSNTATFRIVQH